MKLPPQFFSYFKEGFWIFFGQFSNVIGNLILLNVLTNKLSPDNFGEVSLALTFVGLITQGVLGNIPGGIARFYSIAIEKKDFNNFYKASIYLLRNATTIVIIISLIILIFFYLTYDFSFNFLLFPFIVLFSIVSYFNSTLSSVLNAARQRVIVALHNGGEVFLKIFFVVILTIFFSSNVFIVISYFISAVLIFFSQFLFFKNYISTSEVKFSHLKINVYFVKKWIRDIWAWSWPFSVWGLITWLHLASDKWLLEYYSDLTTVGKYSVLYQLGFTPISLFTSFLISFLSPIFYDKSGDATDESRNKIVHKLSFKLVKISVLVTLLATIVTYFLHQFIFDIFVAFSFRDVSYLLPIFVLAGGFFATGQLLSLKQMSEMKTKSMLPIKIFTSFFGIIMNFFGAMFFGLLGVSISILLFSIVYLLWSLFISRK